MIFLFQRCDIFRLKEVPLPGGRTCPLPLAGTDDVGDGSRITLVECTALCRNEERDERSWRPPMFSTLGWMVWVEKESHVFFCQHQFPFWWKGFPTPNPHHDHFFDWKYFWSARRCGTRWGRCHLAADDVKMFGRIRKKSSEKSPGSKNHGISKLVCWRCQTPCEQHIQTPQKSQGSVILRAFASQRHMASKLIVKFWIVVFLVVSDMFIDVHCV